MLWFSALSCLYIVYVSHAQHVLMYACWWSRCSGWWMADGEECREWMDDVVDYARVELGEQNGQFCDETPSFVGGSKHREQTEINLGGSTMVIAEW